MCILYIVCLGINACIKVNFYIAFNEFGVSFGETHSIQVFEDIYLSYPYQN